MWIFNTKMKTCSFKFLFGQPIIEDVNGFVYKSFSHFTHKFFIG